MELAPQQEFVDPEGKLKHTGVLTYQFETNVRAPRINRYYKTLKPYYKL